MDKVLLTEKLNTEEMTTAKTLAVAISLGLKILTKMQGDSVSKIKSINNEAELIATAIASELAL